ncbi:MAG: hypothetical protein IJ737_00880 [Ruminococcus sp.]|nr:hypothetical protein [Ruminococcus sp.]
MKSVSMNFKRVAAAVAALAIAAGTISLLPQNRTGLGTQLSASADEALPGAHSCSNEEGDVFLGGNYMEVGISKAGSFGTEGFLPEDAEGWHNLDKYSGRVGLMVDGDGFDVGEESTTGDFFLPGTPEERHSLAYSIDDEFKYNYAAYLNHNDWIDPIQELTTVDTSDVENGQLSAVTTGITADNIKIEQTISFGVNDKYFKISVVVTNLNDFAVDNVRYVRSVDPDMDEDIYDTFHTYNKVICNPNSNIPYTPNQCALVVAKGPTTLKGFFYAAFDKNARASILYGLNTKPYGTDYYGNPIWYNNDELPTTPSDEAIELTREMLDDGNLNGYLYRDSGVALTFNWDTIEAGGSRKAVVYESLDPDVITALANVSKDTEGLSKVYNGSEQVVSEADLNIVDGAGNVLTMGVDYELTGDYAATDVGTYNFDIVYKGDYEFIGTQPMVWEIEKAPLTITASDVTYVVGSEPIANGVVCTGFVGSDDESVLDGAFEFSFGDYTPESPVGDYTISVTGVTSNNYDITFVDGTLHIVEKMNYTAENVAWTKGSGETVAVKPVRESKDGAESYMFSGNVTVDGEACDFTVNEEDFSIVFTNEFLETLELGDHEVVVTFVDGESKSVLSVLKAEESSESKTESSSKADSSSKAASTTTTTNPTTGGAVALAGTALALGAVIATKKRK